MTEKLQKRIEIEDKSDQSAVDQIIAMGYPQNLPYLDQLLEWTCDPNWPIAASIFQYFVQLGKQEVRRVLNVAHKADYDWRYTLIIQIIADYDKETLASCTEFLVSWARQTGSDECDIESLRILYENALVEQVVLARIVRRNLFVYNLWIKETFDAAGDAIYQLPLGEHHL